MLADILVNDVWSKSWLADIGLFVFGAQRVQALLLTNSEDMKQQKFPHFEVCNIFI